MDVTSTLSSKSEGSKEEQEIRTLWQRCASGEEGVVGWRQRPRDARWVEAIPQMVFGVPHLFQLASVECRVMEAWLLCRRPPLPFWGWGMEGGCPNCVPIYWGAVGGVDEKARMLGPKSYWLLQFMVEGEGLLISSGMGLSRGKCSRRYVRWVLFVCLFPFFFGG